jgi:hypothetical protein
MPALNRILPSWRGLSASLVLACSALAGEAMETPAYALAEGVDQLRQSVGTWNVATTQYQEDGTVAHTVEMVSVGADGHLWVMSGPLVGETRTTPVTPTADGRKMQLRFTRFNVQPNHFESRREVSLDGGESWKPGNHQRFVRATGEPVGAAGLRYRKRSQNYVPLT